MYQERGFGGGRGGGFRDGGNRGFSNDRSLTPPVREGQEVDVTVEAVGEKGDGIAKVQGFVLFVPATKAGDRVRIRITRVLQKVGFGQVIGEAQTPAGTPVTSQRERTPKPEFNPNEEMDSEDFGDEEGSGDGESSGDGANGEASPDEDAGDDDEDDASDEEKE